MTAIEGAERLTTTLAPEAVTPRRGLSLRLAGPLVAALVMTLTLLAVLFIDLSSAARAFVGGESLWSKAQKSAVLALMEQAQRGDEASWQRYLDAIAVPLGDRRARLALGADQPDLAQAELGFLAGGLHPDDIPGMIRLYRLAHAAPPMARAIAIWAEADVLIAELDEQARRLRQAVRSGAPPQRIEAIVAALVELNDRLTPLEEGFSRTLGEASRLVRNGLSAALIAGALMLVALLWSWLRRAQRESAAYSRTLNRREVLFRSLWETTADGVLVIDAHNTIRLANPAIARLFGHLPGELIGRSLSALQPGDLREGHERAMRRFVREGTRSVDWHGVETRGRHREGHELPLEISFSDFKLDGEHLFVGFLRDVTRRKQTEQALEQANSTLERRVAERTDELVHANARLRELDRLKSEFVASVSHELRTPLNAVLGFTWILLSGGPGPLNDEQRRQLGFIKSSGDHLLHLINEVLDLSRLESGHMALAPEDFDLVALAAEVVAQMQPLAQAKQLSLLEQLPGSLPLTHDRTRVKQVLLNLVGNAVKFTAHGQVALRVLGAGGHARIEVEDTGPGIAPADLERIFEPFHQIAGGASKPHEGSGLGLHLSQRLAQHMGGRIEVRSEPGAGSCFTLWLPVQGPQRAALTNDAAARR